MKIFQEIADLIALEPPISVFQRLTRSFSNVIPCKSKNYEDFNRYVSRFRPLAANHVMRAGSSSQSQIGEKLSITLLNNNSLSEAFLINSKLRLIVMAEGRSTGTFLAEKKFKLTLFGPHRNLLCIGRLSVSIARASQSFNRN